jgi:hypothetical protein
MHHRRIVLTLALAVLAAALILPAAALATPAPIPTAYDQAIDNLYAKGYPQGIESYLINLGTSALGMRAGGTSADNHAAMYIADKLRAAGYANVKLEKVPLDVWDMRGASVTVGPETFTCSQFSGVPGTPAAGLTGDVVYVNAGTAADYESVNVKGKLVLVDSDFEDTWLNFQAAEATKHGAIGVILTYGPTSYPWYAVAVDALGSNDGEYDMSYVPLVYLSQQDGDWLKTQIAGGDTAATMTSDVHVTMAADGGFGYNVLATLPGKVRNTQRVIIDAHHDAHMRAGMDDTGAVVTTLAMAKAMKMTGFTPKHDIVFMFDTGEEFGYTNCWYDWSVGAWHFITKRHPDWVGSISAMWSVELMAAHGGTLDFNTSPEMQPWLAAQATKWSEFLPNGYTLETPQSTWQNGWSFQASGVPSFEVSSGGPGYDEMYHSSYETADKLDYDYMGQIDKFFMRLFQSADHGVLPYSFSARADELSSDSVVDADELGAAGVARANARGLTKAIAQFSAAAAHLDARKGHIPAGRRAAANQSLIRAAKRTLKGMTALDAWDYTAYPHQQTMWDVEYIDAAIAALQADPVDPAAASDALANVALTYYGQTYSHSVYLYELTRHDPDYYRVVWGGLGKLINYYDMIPVLAKIDDTDYSGAVASLTKMRNAGADDLNARVVAMTRALNGATARIEAAR